MKYFNIIKFTLIIPANNKTAFYEWQNAIQVFCSTPTFENKPKGTNLTWEFHQKMNYSKETFYVN